MMNRIKDTIQGVAAAFLGVQSNKNRERDFKEGKLSDFVLVGLVAVVLFILVLVGLVQIALSTF